MSDNYGTIPPEDVTIKLYPCEMTLPKVYAIISVICGGLAAVLFELPYVAGLVLLIVPYLFIIGSVIFGVLALRCEKEDKITRLLAIVGILLSVVTFVITLGAIITVAVAGGKSPGPKQPFCGGKCKKDSDCPSVCPICRSPFNTCYVT